MDSVACLLNIIGTPSYITPPFLYSPLLSHLQDTSSYFRQLQIYHSIVAVVHLVILFGPEMRFRQNTIRPLAADTTHSTKAQHLQSSEPALSRKCTAKTNTLFSSTFLMLLLLPTFLHFSPFFIVVAHKVGPHCFIQNKRGSIKMNCVKSLYHDSSMTFNH